MFIRECIYGVNYNNYNTSTLCNVAYIIDCEVISTFKTK